MSGSRISRWYRKSRRDGDASKQRSSDESLSDDSTKDSPQHHQSTRLGKKNKASPQSSTEGNASSVATYRSRSPLSSSDDETSSDKSYHSRPSVSFSCGESGGREENNGSGVTEQQSDNSAGGREEREDDRSNESSNEGNARHDDLDLEVQERHMDEGQYENEDPDRPRAFSESSGSDDHDGAESDGSNDDQTDSEGNLSEDQEEGMNNQENQPLFAGSEITFKDSLLAILTFVLCHKLTGQCLGDLLSLIALHCGANSLCVKTLYKFKTYFKMIGKDVIICHFFCSVCEVPLEKKDSVCNTCNGQHAVAYFIEFPIVTQLLKLFSRAGFYESLRFKTNRVKKNRENVEDVYDGAIYQQLIQSGFLSDPNNISFFMYFDGISLFKSSNFSIWPIYLSINELKYTQRTKKENVILAGIWFGKSKPNPNLFLQPLHSELSSLEQNGVNVTLPNGEHARVRAKLIGAVGDMPAKSTFMRFIQYNGAYSCFHCMAQGGRYDLGRITIQVFPYSRAIELRKNEEIPEFASQALIAHQRDPDASIYGVKGPSLLWAMLPNLVLCMGIDIMHGVFLNVMRTLLHLWFDPQFSGNPFNVKDFVRIVDARLKTIKPPTSFKVLRTIEKELALMKASDLKNFFYYYSLPVLLGILPERYWYHHYKLVTAIAMLSQESISMHQINQAEELLHLYVSEFQNLYNIRYLTLSFHQLLHLPLVVRNLGPLWVYSCFFYESLNGELARLVHGSRHAAMQICSSSSVYMNLSVMISNLNDGSAVKNLCLRFLGRSKQQFKLTENVDHQTDVVGKMTLCLLPADLRRFLQNSYGIDGGRIKSFQRLKIKGTVYSSETYVRSIQKVNCFVEILGEETQLLAKITMFFRWSACEDCDVDCAQCQKRFFCAVSLYERIPWEAHDAPDQPVVLPYLERVSPTNHVCVFPVDRIMSICLYMYVDGKEYIARQVNALEVE